ncbi:MULTISPECIES: glycoside hydrolase family 9 protein [Flavobacteriaceae]|uniref:glycoside hydrolase family 9 protein n=1 Tax=Flavobacteriaceae TaxID=49546 RepID=UPI0023495E1B|nr:glycoside hydrolase family 9 protein [Muricauda sp. SP22]MDC6362539.1 glycoside hydrolase family 9 protein [Muricauda sp. SP22]
MKNRMLLVFFIFAFAIGWAKEESWIRINNLGYLPQSIKVAVLGSKVEVEVKSFSLVDAVTGKKVYTSRRVMAKGTYGPFASSYRLDFSDFEATGRYFIQANTITSPEFDINANVYDNTADFLLKYMRQQRCGYNPFLTDSCHMDDGFIVYNPKREGERIDVTGGWHDASDYLQYTATSANAVYQLLLAYRENPGAFGDMFQANGLPGKNGIPDIIDEAKFGMDWLKKMNPSPEEYYNQIADDRDHAGYRLPNKDSVIYDENRKGRPVYLASAEKQGLKKYQNRSTGAASTAGKFASAFAIGGMVLKDFYPEYTEDLLSRARNAYDFGKKNPGVSQTAPCKAPYFYEEENWHDDMELAAGALYNLTGDAIYKNEGMDFAQKEQISPWIGKDTVRHYQYYPFLNAGHFELAVSGKNQKAKNLANLYKKGLKAIHERGKDNAFLIGTPFVWCSNNFVTAAVTQSHMYRELTGDDTYLEMEAALRDWLFGCNPWGTSMIVGLPGHADSPVKPHSSLTVLEGYATYGGLVDGPVYGSIFNSLIGIKLEEEDSYAEFQSDLVVYHDDIGDYSTNEPTMDGTASLVYYLSSMESKSQKAGHKKADFTYDESGALIRGNTSEKKINLTFTGDQYADGLPLILETLDKHQIKGSFFFTGNFYRNTKYATLIKRLKDGGHYLGAHSDKHLLYNDWSPQKKLLVTQYGFQKDLLDNYEIMAEHGIQKEDAPFFMPPYEWNSSEITQWTNQLDLSLINYTPGTISHADYTTPDMENYRSSAEIMESILSYEEKEGLHGFLLLTHVGTDPNRTDKFYNRLEELITTLNGKGYKFVSLEELLAKKNP